MRKTLRRPGSLFKRLTLSYILVTLLAALTIEIAGTFVPAITEYLNANITPAQQITKTGQAQYAPYFTAPKPNVEAIRYWVAIPFYDTLSKDPGGAELIAVFDRNGTLLTSTACGNAQWLANSAQNCATLADHKVAGFLETPNARHWLHTVLNARQPDVVSSKTNDGRTLLALPIIGEGKQVVAVLVAVLDTAPRMQVSPTERFSAFLSILESHLRPDGLYFILLASLLGTIAGMLISLSLSRRFSAMVLAVDSWSHGKLQARINDHVQDEVGQLARNLNRMALQLQLLLPTQQALAVVEERKRLARDLHDSVKQQIFGSALLLRAAGKIVERDPQTARRHLHEAEVLTEQVQQELVAVIQALRPATLADRGLAVVVRKYLANWSQRTAITSDLLVEGEQQTPLDIEETLFFILREALANVFRHSQASQVEVRLLWASREICMTIHDNGTGFQVERATGNGIGLLSMRERMEALAGTVAITSVPGETVIKTRAPLSTAKQAIEVRDV